MNRFAARIVYLVALLLAPAVVAGPVDDARAAAERGDFAATVAILKPLAERGDAPARYYLGSMYATGKGVPQNWVEAVGLITQAAEQGYAQAQYDLGVMYRDGLGVARDDAETVRWWRRAAEQGFAYAQNNLGIRYANGRGIPRDDIEALALFRKAADQGHPGSLAWLGIMYAEGRGVAKDLVAAYKWLSIAAVQVPRSQRNEVLDRRGQIEKSMSAAQVEQALQSAGAWTPPGAEGAPYRVVGYSSVYEGAGTPIAGGKPVTVGSFTVDAPPGEDWHVHVDAQNDLATFGRMGQREGLTNIAVIRIQLNPGYTDRSEADLVAAIERFEIANATAHGSTRAYALADVATATTAVGERQLHVMRYTVCDASGPVAVRTATTVYYYLPPDYRQSGRIFAFFVEQTTKVGAMAFAADPAIAIPVIASLRTQ
jgi:hypothetical protein